MKRVVNVSALLLLLGAAVTGAVWVGERITASRLNARCVENLESIGAALRAYSTVESNRDFFPPLSLTRGRMMFDPETLYPDLLSETMCFVSPFHPDHASLRTHDSEPTSLIDDTSYWYLGYLFANERSALAWIDEYKRVIPVGGLPADVNGIWPEYVSDFEARDQEVRARYEEALARYEEGLEPYDPRTLRMMSTAHPHLHEMHVVCVLRSGVERFLITDVGNPFAVVKLQSEIPVMVERPELHGNGGHVLYLDGHVEFLPYPGPFPMTEAFIEGLRSLDRMEPDQDR